MFNVNKETIGENNNGGKYYNNKPPPQQTKKVTFKNNNNIGAAFDDNDTYDTRRQKVNNTGEKKENNTKNNFFSFGKGYPIPNNIYNKNAVVNLVGYSDYNNDNRYQQEEKEKNNIYEDTDYGDVNDSSSDLLQAEQTLAAAKEYNDFSLQQKKDTLYDISVDLKYSPFRYDMQRYIKDFIAASQGESGKNNLLTMYLVCKSARINQTIKLCERFSQEYMNKPTRLIKPFRESYEEKSDNTNYIIAAFTELSDSLGCFSNFNDASLGYILAIQKLTKLVKEYRADAADKSKAIIFVLVSFEDYLRVNNNDCVNMYSYVEESLRAGVMLFQAPTQILCYANDMLMKDPNGNKLSTYTKEMDNKDIYLDKLLRQIFADQNNPITIKFASLQLDINTVRETFKLTNSIPVVLSKAEARIKEGFGNMHKINTLSVI